MAREGSGNTGTPDPILGIIGLGADDYAWADLLRCQFSQGELATILDACYQVLRTHPEFRPLAGGSGLGRLREVHTHQLLTLGRDFESAAYVDARLKIGQECALAGFPLRLVQPLHVAIRRHLLAALHERPGSPPDLSPFADFLVRIFTLDAYLIIEAYRRYEAEAAAAALEDLRQEAARLHRKSQIDELTGVNNFSRLMEFLDHQIELAKRKRKPLCVMMSDLDRFKRVNDTYGHLAGDEVLRHVAERIQSAVRDFDMVGRFGGEEFAIILVNTDRELAETIGERIRREIAAAPIHLKGLNIPITISIGLAMLRDGDNRETILARADRAMYEAKRQGRNRLCVAANEDDLP